MFAPPISSVAPLLHRLHVKICRQLVFSNTYRSITDVHDKLQAFSARIVLIGLIPRNSFLGTQRFFILDIRVFFRFLRDIVVTPSELDIPPALIICSVIHGAHLPYYYASVGSLTPVLNTIFFAVADFQLVPLLLPPPLPPSSEH